MLIDIHVHSDNSSCSRMSIDEILNHAREYGLDGVCITDHDTTAVLSQITEGFQPDGLLVLVGMEYSTPQGDFLVFGDVESLEVGMDAPVMMARVREAGGAIVAAHPFRGWRPSDVSVITDGQCDAIEVVNGRNTDMDDFFAEGLATKTGLARSSGSDAHTLEELGQFPTRFRMPIANRSDLVTALKRGLCEPARLKEALATAS